jgi:hypothetical protein
MQLLHGKVLSHLIFRDWQSTQARMRVGLEDAVGGGVAPGAEPCEPGVNEASTGAVHVDVDEEYMTMRKRKPGDSSQFRIARASTDSREVLANCRPIKSERRRQAGQPGQAAAPEKDDGSGGRSVI